MGVTESHLLALLGETLAEDDAEWMPGKSRTRLTPDLDNGFLMDAWKIPHSSHRAVESLNLTSGV
jgi:hypothetical protein